MAAYDAWLLLMLLLSSDVTLILHSHPSILTSKVIGYTFQASSDAWQVVCHILTMPFGWSSLCVLQDSSDPVRV